MNKQAKQAIVILLAVAILGITVFGICYLIAPTEKIRVEKEFNSEFVKQ